MLGQRISLLRRQAGMSQADLAAQLGISPSAVGMYEQGRREPSVELLVHLSEIFNVTADYLLTGRISAERDVSAVESVLRTRLESARAHLRHRSSDPLEAQELATLLAAVLLE